MITFAQFKQSLGVPVIDFKKTAKGRQVATVFSMSSHGVRVETKVWKALKYDITNPSKFIVAVGDGTYVLCNSTLTAGDVE